MRKYAFILIVFTLLASCKKEEKKEPIQISAEKTDVSAYGGSDGAVLLTISGGTEPYSYLWSNGAGTRDLLEVSAGSYTVTVTDASNDTASHTETVNQPEPPAALEMEYVKKDVSKVGEADGYISLHISGGIEPYTISWSNGASEDSIADLATGVYDVTVSDASQQQLDESIELLAPLTISITSTNASSYDGTDGSIDLLIEGGKEPYVIEWSNGESDEDLSGLSGGYYKVTVTDVNEQSRTRAATIYEAFDLEIAEAEILQNVERFNNSGFRIEYDTKVIYIDPINRPDAYENDADIILITHDHSDHMQTGIISELAGSSTTVLCPANCVDRIAGAVSGAEVLAVDQDTVKTVDGITIEVVPAYNANHSLPNSVGYILTLNGIRFYHAGDTERITEMTSFNVDIACIPLGQVYTFASLEEAAGAAEDVGATVIVPMHYPVNEGKYSDPWDIKEMLAGSIYMCAKMPLE